MKTGYFRSNNSTVLAWALRAWKAIAGALLLIGSVQTVHGQYDPVQPYQGTTGRDLAGTQQWWQARDKHTAGAPNVVWILLDDVGFGAISTFGGLIKTPTLDSLANNGLRYTNFHTTAICSPTRAA